MSGESVAGVAVMGVIGVAGELGWAAGAGFALVAGHETRALAARLERDQARLAAEQAERERWAQAVREVATRNARIEALRAAVTGDESVEVLVPVPLVLAKQGLDELFTWCQRTDAELERVQRVAVERSIRRMILAGVLAAGVEDRARPVATAADVLAVESGVSGTSAWREQISEQVQRVLTRLPAETMAVERDELSQATARVLAAPTLGEARNRLDDLRLRMGEVSRAVAARRDEAAEAAALLQPLAHAIAAPDGTDSVDSVRIALNDVLAGRRRLDARLRDEAVRAVTVVKEAVDRVYVQRTVTEALGELGYTVEEGMQTMVPRGGALQLAHSGWPQHAVRVLVDAEGRELRAVVVRTRQDGGWDSAQADEERERQWCASLRRLRDLLEDRGIGYDVHTLVDPGIRPAPVVTTQEPPAAGTRAEARKLTR